MQYLYTSGGALAQLAAVWASVTWTDTLLRCVTFGTPPVSRIPQIAQNGLSSRFSFLGLVLTR